MRPAGQRAIGHYRSGTALIVGGGIGGIEAALRLATAGFKVVVAESAPVLGGRMAQLDKTFPTNDCSTCIFSPKIGAAGNHPNIKVLTQAEVLRLEGRPGNFQATILLEPRCVDPNTCTACGSCAEKCPVKVGDAFNLGLAERRAIYLPYPQAVPHAYVVDRDHCLHFTKKKCGVCQRLCPAGAVDLEAKPKVVHLDIGAVIVASGSRAFEVAADEDPYGYQRFANVITSLQLERLLAASGPTSGRLIRPGDGREPARVAFVQCVGSRDPHHGRGYCSGFCCMAAVKQAVLVREHQGEGLKATIYYIDLRACGKGHEEYLVKARERYGIGLVPAKVARIEENADGSLSLFAMDASGRFQRHGADLVVLSVGQGPEAASRRLASRLGLALDRQGFLRRRPNEPTATSRRGIFACGGVLAPSDITDTVVAAGAAACKAAELLAAERVDAESAAMPPESGAATEPEPRVGVFVCRCGVNIGAYVDVAAVVAAAKELPAVVHAEEKLFACASDACKDLIAAIQAQRLNRVVVASCSPRSHAPLFEATVAAAGLNQAFVEMANIREQCAWVHGADRKAATHKAKVLVRAAVLRVAAARARPATTIKVMKAALVIGGGLAGMRAALAIAAQGFQCHLVERQRYLGGNLRRLHFALNGGEPQKLLRRTVRAVRRHPLIAVHLQSTVRQVQGRVGEFRSVVAKTDGSGDEKIVEHGVVVVATGASELQPQGQYLHGVDPRVVTQGELERLLARDDGRLPRRLRTVVMIQCVGSRTAERPYCSRLCCATALKNCLILKRRYPGAEIHVLYRDLRAYGLLENYYQRAREQGVLFARYDPEEPPRVELRQDRFGTHLRLQNREPLLGARLELRPDLLVLSSAIVPAAGADALAALLRVPLDENGFFLEAHCKLRPVELGREGVFVCGMAHYPKRTEESIMQAEAAAMHAAAILAHDQLTMSGDRAEVNRERCTGCLTCRHLCPRSVPQIDASGKAWIDPAECDGCGICAAECPAGAISMMGCTDAEILGAVGGLGVAPFP